MNRTRACARPVRRLTARQGRQSDVVSRRGKLVGARFVGEHGAAGRPMYLLYVAKPPELAVGSRGRQGEKSTNEMSSGVEKKRQSCSIEGLE